MPIRWLSRLHLPLTWLRTQDDSLSVRSGALYTMDISHLELPRSAETDVLIARHSPNGGLYAIEEVDHGLHIVCALHSWITYERLCNASDTRHLEEDLEYLKDYLKAESLSGQGRITTTLSTRCTPKKPKNRRGILARQTILPVTGEVTGNAGGFTVTCQNSSDSRASDLGNVTQEQPAENAVIGGTAETPETNSFEYVSASAEHDSALVQQKSRIDHANSSSLVDVTTKTSDGPSFDLIRHQYLETLYGSKTSLAYFSKGPLTRARIASQNENTAPGKLELPEIYREVLVPSRKMDSKYKEAIFKIIEASANHSAVTGTVDPNNTVQRKKKRSSKKLGKDGLYIGEDEYIKRWWHSQEIPTTSLMSAGSSNQDLRYAVSELRSRESAMQILLILEIMALEASSARRDLNESVIQAEAHGTVTAVSVIKQKKKRDLSGDLEALLDRLCIWQTLDLDGVQNLSHETPNEENQQSSDTKDKLREFCADVIIPFYASRIPDPCKLICRRLGGPDLSPKRPRPSLQRASTTSRLKPGAAVNSRTRPATKRTLERVLSEDMNSRHASPPVLSRSSSISFPPSIKRESCESSQRPGSRGNLHKPVTFSNREVDLEGDAKLQDAKKKKLARLAAQKKELDAAIEALKKPNRTKAAQALMDEHEQRAHEKVGPRIQRQVVQITATPRRSHSKMRTTDQIMCGAPHVDLRAEEAIIPSSTIRPRPVSGENATSSTPMDRKRTTLSTIHNTPSRRPPSASKPTSSVQPPISADRPTAPSVIAATPATDRVRPALHPLPTPLRMTKCKKPVLFTPIKKTDVQIEHAFRDAPVLTAQPGHRPAGMMLQPAEPEGMISIYDALGWNDD